MDCSSCSELIAARLNATLSGKDASEVDEHLDGCQSCRQEYERTDWLLRSMHETKAQIDTGHVSPRLLYEYSDGSESLEDAAIQFIERHLDTCKPCSEDYARIQELIYLPLTIDEPAGSEAAPRLNGRVTTAPAPPSGVRGVLDQILARIPGPKNALAYGGLAVALMAVIVIVGIRLGGTSKVAGWASLDVIETSVPIQEVPMRIVRRGVPRGTVGSDTMLDVENLNRFVIAVDLDFVDGSAMSYEIEIKDFADEIVWSGEIPEEHLNDGRALINLRTKHFPDGRYTLDILAYETDGFTSTIAETSFEISR